jgi:hypothetical protein
MADTGWKFPSEQEDNSNWDDASRMEADDSSDAVANNTPAIVTQYNFSFSIPAGSSIDGVEVEIEGFQFEDMSQDPVTMEITPLYNSRGSSATAKTSTQLPVWPADPGTVTFGGSSDTWGRSWSVSDFSNTNFGVKIKASWSDVGGQASIDYLRTKIYYSAGGWSRKVNGVAGSSISKINGVATSSIAKVNGVS